MHVTIQAKLKVNRDFSQINSFYTKSLIDNLCGSLSHKFYFVTYGFDVSMLHIGYISAVDQLSVFVNQIKLNFVFLDIEKQTTDQLLICN